MRDVRVGAAQFEHRDGDKPYNLGRIHDLARRAARQGAEIVSFHECSMTGYTFLTYVTGVPRATSPASASFTRSSPPTCPRARGTTSPTYAACARGSSSATTTTSPRTSVPPHSWAPT